MDHSSHHSHHHHHNSATTENTSSDVATTIASTLTSTLATTLTSLHHKHAHGDGGLVNSMVADSPVRATHVHAEAVAGGDHMPMYFHFGVDSIILFQEWTTTTVQALVFSVLAICILAVLYEGIKFFRECLFKRYFTSLEYSSVSVLGEDGRPVTEVHKVARNRMFSWPHLFQTLLHIVQMVLSYFLMLIFMTFNVWLCAGVIIGSGIGYFLFGWRKATVVDITEHCH